MPGAYLYLTFALVFGHFQAGGSAFIKFTLYCHISEGKDSVKKKQSTNVLNS
jgi:hypothetical protein